MGPCPDPRAPARTPRSLQTRLGADAGSCRRPIQVKPASAHADPAHGGGGTDPSRPGKGISAIQSAARCCWRPSASAWPTHHPEETCHANTAHRRWTCAHEWTPAQPEQKVMLQIVRGPIEHGAAGTPCPGGTAWRRIASLVEASSGWHRRRQRTRPPPQPGDHAQRAAWAGEIEIRASGADGTRCSLRRHREHAAMAQGMRRRGRHEQAVALIMDDHRSGLRRAHDSAFVPSARPPVAQKGSCSRAASRALTWILLDLNMRDGDVIDTLRGSGARSEARRDGHGVDRRGCGGRLARRRRGHLPGGYVSLSHARGAAGRPLGGDPRSQSTSSSPRCAASRGYNRRAPPASLSRSRALVKIAAGLPCNKQIGRDRHREGTVKVHVANICASSGGSRVEAAVWAVGHLQAWSGGEGNAARQARRLY